MTLKIQSVELNPTLVDIYGTWRTEEGVLMLSGQLLNKPPLLIQQPKSAYYALKKNIILCMIGQEAVWTKDPRYSTPAATEHRAFYDICNL